MPDQKVEASDTQDAPPGRGIRFRESMPRPLMLTFLAFGAVGVGLMIWLMFRPPSPGLLALESRRSPPVGSFTHDVVHLRPIAIPTPLPPFTPRCAEIEGLVIEGGEPAQGRIDGVLTSMCALAKPGAPPEAQQAFLALAKARIRFAKFTRTGDQSTLDLEAGRIFLTFTLSEHSVAPVAIGPLLVHEGWHLSVGGTVTAAQEYDARLAELQACQYLLEPKVYTRGCLDAEAIVRLGEARAVELLVRAGFPR